MFKIIRDPLSEEGKKEIANAHRQIQYIVGFIVVIMLILLYGIYYYRNKSQLNVVRVEQLSKLYIKLKKFSDQTESMF